MKEYLLLLRVNVKALSASQIEQRTQQWGALIPQLMQEGKLIDTQIFENDGCYVTGVTERTVVEMPVADNNEIVGGIIMVSVNDLNEAIEIAKRCPTIDFGGRVEIRALQAPRNRGQKPGV